MQETRAYSGLGGGGVFRSRGAYYKLAEVPGVARGILKNE